MEFYTPRKLMFKAWNTESKLLIRLDAIPCVRGELKKANHILLQYTGLKDKQHEDLYEMDIVLIGREKFIIQWDTPQSCWCMVSLSNSSVKETLLDANARKMIRLCNYFESQQDQALGIGP